MCKAPDLSCVPSARGLVPVPGEAVAGCRDREGGQTQPGGCAACSGMVAEQGACVPSRGWGASVHLVSPAVTDSASRGRKRERQSPLPADLGRLCSRGHGGRPFLYMPRAPSFLPSSRPLQLSAQRRRSQSVRGDILAGALGRPLHSAGDGLVTLPLPTPGSELRWRMLPGTLLRACLPASAWGQQAGDRKCT